MKKSSGNNKGNFPYKEAIILILIMVVASVMVFLLPPRKNNAGQQKTSIASKLNFVAYVSYVKDTRTKYNDFCFANIWYDTKISTQTKPQTLIIACEEIPENLFTQIIE